MSDAEPANEQGALGAVPEYPTGALPQAARELVEYGSSVGLPGSLVAGAALAAMAAAVGPNAELEVTRSWHQRAIVWVVAMAPRGAGKTPSQDLAFGPLRAHDAQVDEGRILIGDTTLEALSRTLAASGGAGAIDQDELTVLLRAVNEYKGGGGDVGRLLALWAGAPVNVDRVGAGGSKANQVGLRIPRPTLVICGGLQTQRDELLGDEESGLRPRWLPHIATMPEDGGTLGRSGAPAGWQLLIGGHLIPGRPTPRTWQLDKAAFAAFRDYREAYKAQARGVETGSTTAALGKADTHLARIALVLAEAQDPAAGGTIGTDTIERAAQIVDYTLDCWRSLPERGGLALSRRDEALDRGIPRLVAWLEEHGGEAIRTDLHRAHVAGCRTADELTALLARYEAIYPGRVVTETPEHGGTPTTTVRAPKRRAVSPVAIEVAVRNRNRTAKPNRGGYIDGIANGVATSPTTTSEAVSPEIGYTDLATPTKTPIPKPEKPLTHPGYTDTGYTDDAGGGDRAEAELRRATQKFGGGVV